MENRFEGIEVIDDGPDVYSRSKDGRIMFRFNRIDGTFALFRSTRISDAEKEFTLIMFDKLSNDMTETSREDVKCALEYKLEKDLFCT
jgi:hypothetical protein